MRQVARITIEPDTAEDRGKVKENLRERMARDAADEAIDAYAPTAAVTMTFAMIGFLPMDWSFVGTPLSMMPPMAVQRSVRSVCDGAFEGHLHACWRIFTRA